VKVNLLASLLICSGLSLVAVKSACAQKSKVLSDSAAASGISSTALTPQDAISDEPSVVIEPGPIQLKVTQASKKYDFEVQMNDGCEKQFEDSDICEGPASIRIYPKGTQSEKQRIILENLSVIRVGKAEVLVNTAELYDYQGSLMVDDFNFDGQEDLAVQVGQNGPYGGPTFQVYLYHSRKGKFLLSEKLSAMTEENMGLFHIDPTSKRIGTFAKSGCCYHVSQEYEFVGTEPVVVAKFTEDATGSDGFATETTERLVKGRWVRHVQRVRIPDSGEDW